MFLADEIDALGNTVTVHHSKLEFSPAYSFFLKQQADLIDNGQCAPCTYWEDDNSEIIWVERDGKVIGTSCFTTKLLNRSVLPLIYTHSTFVNSQYRRIGIQKILFKYFQNIAEKYNCKAISQTIGINNFPRLEGTKANGLNPLTSIFIKNVDKTKLIEDHISLDLDPIGKPIFEFFLKDREKLKKYLVELGHSDSVAHALTAFDETTTGLMWIEDESGIRELISFDKKEIKKGKLSIQTTFSYKYIDTLANYFNCSRIVIKLSVKDTVGSQIAKDYGFDHIYFVLYKQINRKD
jgi:hypothetical protein